MKSYKISYNIYAGIERLIEIIDGCANNPENSSTAKIGEHFPCGCSMSTIWTFAENDDAENKHTLYCGEDYMKKFVLF